MSDRDSDIPDESPDESRNGSMYGSVGSLARDTEYLSDVVAGQSMEESEEDGDYVE